MSPERRGGDEHYEEPDRPYYWAVRFLSEGAARRAYFAAQDLVQSTELAPELSTYRFLLNGIWHVGVLGDQPDEAFERDLQRTLRGGSPTNLPDDVLDALTERREQATRQGSWVERHYRSSKDY